jgi:glycosyltransferase involved in cell wall biosynthesis
MDTISIGITCFNAAESIERAVRSAQQQTWPRFEIVAVDDCSTDASWAALERLASADERMRIVRHPHNRGVGAARNTVLAYATGAFVAFFDDDDASQPERLVEQYRRIVEYERATGARIVLCYAASLDEYPGGPTEYSAPLGADATPAPAGDDVARLILLGKPTAGGRGVCPTSTQMARRDVYQLVGGFDENLRRHEDTDLNLRLALRGAHFAGMANPLVVRTMTATPDKSVRSERESALQLIEKHRDVLERWHWYEFVRRWSEMKFARLDGGAASALPHALRLFFTSPLKTMRKVAWTLPNRARYSKYRYSHAAGA